METHLLCDEVWLPTSPASPPSTQTVADSFYTTAEDCEQALTISLQKELDYMPEPEYWNCLRRSGFANARQEAVQWLIECQSRWNLSFPTIFNAVNYLDRFISMNGWKDWAFELITFSCLSVALKFHENSPSPLPEIQDIQKSFSRATIQRAEVAVLQGLGWRLGCTTAFSIAELLLWSIGSSKLNPQIFFQDLETRVTQLLLVALQDSKIFLFRPSVIAISAIRCSLEDLIPSISDADLAFITKMIPHHEMANVVKCRKIMEAQLVDPLQHSEPWSGVTCCCPPSSPVTVLLKDLQTDAYDHCHRLTCPRFPKLIINTPKSAEKKRKMDEQ